MENDGPTTTSGKGGEPRVERRKRTPDKRIEGSDRRTAERVVNEPRPRRQNPDRRKN